MKNEKYTMVCNSGSLSPNRHDTILEAYLKAVGIYKDHTTALCSVWAVPTGPDPENPGHRGSHRVSRIDVAKAIKPFTDSLKEID